MSLSRRPTGRAILSDEDNVDAAVHRRSHEEVFATIRALRNEGLSYSEIERRTRYKRRSVAKWLTFKTPPGRRRATLNPTSPWYFEDFRSQCWKDGNCCGRHLFHDVRLRGYTGSFSNLERLLAARRRIDKPASCVRPSSVANLDPVRNPDTGHAIKVASHGKSRCGGVGRVRMEPRPALA